MVIYVGPPLFGFSSTVPVEADCAATIDGMAACAGTQAQHRSATPQKDAETVETWKSWWTMVDNGG